jgi:hypothetical protein
MTRDNRTGLKGRRQNGSRMILPAAANIVRRHPMNIKALGFAGAAAITVALSAIPAFAHHSFAMFDGDKKVTLNGTVKEFQWTYPHSWIVMMVPDAAGKPQQWPIEMGPPAGLAKEGWVPKTLTPGMKVTLVARPLKDGRNGGQFFSVTLPDGKVLNAGRQAVAGSAAGAP